MILDTESEVDVKQVWLMKLQGQNLILAKTFESICIDQTLEGNWREFEVLTIPGLEEMALSWSAVNKLSLNTRFFNRWARFRMSPNGSISIGWHKRTKHYARRYELALAKSPSGIPKHKTSENTFIYIYITSQIINLYLFSIMNKFIDAKYLFHTISFSHIFKEFKFPKPFWN